MDNTTAIIAEGRNAYTACQERTDCPYTVSIWGGRAWRMGWDAEAAKVARRTARILAACVGGVPA